jgi:hypothetical protein
MKGNLKKAVIMLMVLGFALGLAIGKIQDDANRKRYAPYHQSIILHSPSLKFQSSGLQNDQLIKKEEYLRRVEELKRRALEKAERAEKWKHKHHCH